MVMIFIILLIDKKKCLVFITTFYFTSVGRNGMVLLRDNEK